MNMSDNIEIIEEQKLEGCPGRKYVDTNYCQWYIMVSNPHISKFTMCQYCYEKYSIEEKKLYMPYNGEQNEISSGHFNCDSDLSVLEYSLKKNGVLLYVCDSRNADFKLIPKSQDDKIRKFDVPTGSNFVVVINTRNPDLYLTGEEIEYNNNQYNYKPNYASTTSKYIKEIMMIDLPVACITPSKREINNGFKFSENSNILKMKIQLWKKRTEHMDDVIPRSQFERVDDLVEFEVQLISTQTEEELYDINLKHEKDKMQEEINELVKSLDYLLKQKEDIDSKVKSVQDALKESTEKYIDSFEEAPKATVFVDKESNGTDTEKHDDESNDEDYEDVEDEDVENKHDQQFNFQDAIDSLMGSELLHNSSIEGLSTDEKCCCSSCLSHESSSIQSPVCEHRDEYDEYEDDGDSN